MSLSSLDIGVRLTINQFFVDRGAAPTISELAAAQSFTREAVRDSLARLQQDHRLLLYPGTDEIWVAYPFSSIPSGYWVEAGERGWWGNCGFCSLGIAAMLRRNTTIYSREGGEKAPITLHVDPNAIEPRSHLLHIPVPIGHWHDNIVRTCGNVHYFESDSAIDNWCDRHRVAKGRAVPLSSAWKLAQRWYGNYLDPGWWPRNNTQINQLLGECELTGAFWRMPE